MKTRQKGKKKAKQEGKEKKWKIQPDKNRKKKTLMKTKEGKTKKGTNKEE